MVSSISRRIDNKHYALGLWRPLSYKIAIAMTLIAPDSLLTRRFQRVGQGFRKIALNFADCDDGLREAVWFVESTIAASNSEAERGKEPIKCLQCFCEQCKGRHIIVRWRQK